MALLLVAAVLVIGAIYFTLSVSKEDLAPPDPVSPTQHLEQRKAAIYENLRDLQFEFRLGKLSEADYQKTKQDLQNELAVVLAEIERIQPTRAPKAAPAAPRTPDAQPAPAAAAHPAAETHECTACGARFDQELKFCGECGQPMKHVHKE